MQRVLVVLRGPVVVEELRRRCTLDQPGPHELAIVRVLAADAATLADGLRAQQEITLALRLALGSRAERVAVFVASEADDDGVGECARAWGATLVRT